MTNKNWEEFISKNSDSWYQKNQHFLFYRGGYILSYICHCPPPSRTFQIVPWPIISVTRLGELLQFGQLFKVCVWICLAQIVGNFLKGSNSFIFLVKTASAIFRRLFHRHWATFLLKPSDHPGWWDDFVTSFNYERQSLDLTASLGSYK